MDRERLTALYWDRSEIGPAELDKIVTLLLCFADYVWVNASCWAGGPSDESEDTWTKLEGLTGRGLIRVWSYPLPPVPAHPSSFASRLPASEVVELDRDASRRMYDGVLAALRGYARKMPRVVRAENDDRPEFGGIVEFVNLSSHLWSLSLASYFDAAQTLTTAPALHGFDSQLSKYLYYASLAGPAFRQFLAAHVPAGVGTLDVEDIIRLRKHLGGMRDFVCDALQDVVLELEPTPNTDAAADRINQEYVRLLEDELARSRPQRFLQLGAEQAAMTAIGLVSPALKAIPWAVALCRWQRRVRQRKAPVYFMLELRKRAKR